MNDEYYNKFVDIAKIINKIEEREIEESAELVEEIIKYRYKDEKTISMVFDKILSIGFATEEDIKGIYYKLLNYTKEFNKKLSEDYEEIFIENFKSIDEEWFEK